jgi:KamA family protein
MKQNSVTSFYNKKVEEEIKAIGIGGPLYNCVYRPLGMTDSIEKWESEDFVRDYDNMPNGYKDVIVQKYTNRVLFLATKKCFSYCRYCCRSSFISKGVHCDGAEFENNINRLIDYVNSKPELDEVILSGGDPLTLSNEMLKKAIYGIAHKTHVRNIRIHTRAIVYNPYRFDEELCELLAKHQVRIVFHIVHPYEICEEVKRQIDFCQSYGIKLYAQFPLLRNVNDHELVVKKNLILLDELAVRPLSIFASDPNYYSSFFRIPLKRVFVIVDTVKRASPSWVSSFRPCIDTQHGKVWQEDVVLWDEESNVVKFSFNEKEVVYHDFPERHDSPGDIGRLLWKDLYR